MMMNYFPISAHINYLLRSGLIKNKIYSGDQTLWTPARAAITVKTRPHQLESWPALTRADQSWPEWRTDRWITTLSCLQSADDDLFTPSHLSFDVKNLKIDGPLLSEAVWSNVFMLNINIQVLLLLMISQYKELFLVFLSIRIIFSLVATICSAKKCSNSTIIIAMLT